MQKAKHTLLMIFSQLKGTDGFDVSPQRNLKEERSQKSPRMAYTTAVSSKHNGKSVLSCQPVPLVIG